MATGFLCVWCEKPLLDSDHSKKHVVEQCEKAPHAKLRADLALAVAEVERLRVKVAELEHVVGGMRAKLEVSEKERDEARIDLEIARANVFTNRLSVQLAAAEKELAALRAGKNLFYCGTCDMVVSRGDVKEGAHDHDSKAHAARAEAENAQLRAELERLRAEMEAVWQRYPADRPAAP